MRNCSDSVEIDTKQKIRHREKRDPLTETKSPSEELLYKRKQKTKEVGNRRHKASGHRRPILIQETFREKLEKKERVTG